MANSEYMVGGLFRTTNYPAEDNTNASLIRRPKCSWIGYWDGQQYCPMGDGLCFYPSMSLSPSPSVFVVLSFRIFVSSIAFYLHFLSNLSCVNFVSTARNVTWHPSKYTSSYWVVWGTPEDGLKNVKTVLITTRRLYMGACPLVGRSIGNQLFVLAY